MFANFWTSIVCMKAREIEREGKMEVGICCSSLKALFFHQEGPSLYLNKRCRQKEWPVHKVTGALKNGLHVASLGESDI